MQQQNTFKQHINNYLADSVPTSRFTQGIAEFYNLGREEANSLYEYTIWYTQSNNRKAVANAIPEAFSEWIYSMEQMTGQSYPVYVYNKKEW